MAATLRDGLALDRRRATRTLFAMNRLEQIEAAIRALPARDRSRLAKNLPKLFPELDGDAAWEKLLRDRRTRPALSRLLDEAALAVAEEPAALSGTTDAKFKRLA